MADITEEVGMVQVGGGGGGGGGRGEAGPPPMFYQYDEFTCSTLFVLWSCATQFMNTSIP